MGHIARNCPQKPEGDAAVAPAAAGGRKPRRKGGIGSKRCFNCGQGGHLSADCTVPPGNTACYNCGAEGHKSNACPSK